MCCCTGEGGVLGWWYRHTAALSIPADLDVVHTAQLTSTTAQEPGIVWLSPDLCSLAGMRRARVPALDLLPAEL